MASSDVSDHGDAAALVGRRDVSVIEITEPRTEEEFEDYYRLRYERLRKPHGQPPGSEREDPLEAQSHHAIAKIDGRIVGAECWVLLSRREGRLRRKVPIVRSRQIAVDPNFEGRGVASALFDHVEAWAREIGARELIGNVREEIVPWITRRGWEVRGEGVTLYGTVKSLSMFKRLT
jgi:GNAT superfamily N-acetyltransferase